VGRDSGIGQAQLEALADFENSAVFSEVERSVLRLADAMTAVPVDVSDELFGELREHLSEQQLAELASAIAWEHYRARFNRVFNVDSKDFSEGAFCPLPAR
jgi:alkylhydroperoxidase family enzyme